MAIMMIMTPIPTKTLKNEIDWKMFHSRQKDTYLQPRSVYRNTMLAAMVNGVKNTVQSSENL